MYGIAQISVRRASKINARNTLSDMLEVTVTFFFLIASVKVTSPKVQGPYFMSIIFFKTFG